MIDPKIKALLPAIITDTMDALTQLTNAPDEMTLPVTLAVANFAAQAITDVDPVAWPKAALSEYFVVLVPSGGMKTGVSEYLMTGIKDYERQEEFDYTKRMTEYKIEMKKYSKAIDDEVKSPTGVIPTEPVKPKGIRYKVEKATVNGLINTLTQVPFAGLFSSDAGEFFNSHSFQNQEKSVEMIAMLSKAWSGETIDRVTGIEDNNVKLHNRRFNMLVMLQQELAGFLNNSQYKDQGFTNRMLIAQCGLYQKPAGDFITPAAQVKRKQLQDNLIPFNDRVLQLLNKVDSLQDNARKPRLMLPGEKDILKKLRSQVPVVAEPNELLLEKIEFCLADGAKKVMEDFYNDMITQQTDPKYSEYTNFMARAYEHGCRLAATFAVFDLQKEIKFEYATAAVGLMHWFIDQRLNLEIDASVKSNVTVEVSKDVKKWLKKHGDTTKQSLSQFGPPSYRKLDRDQKKAVLMTLEDNGDVEVVEVSLAGKKSKYSLRYVDPSSMVETISSS